MNGKGVHVKIVKLTKKNRRFEGAEGVSRTPQVGDVGTIVQAYDVIRFSVKCTAADGRTIWLADFYGDELELTE